jgi:hypothetical protein
MTSLSPARTNAAAPRAAPTSAPTGRAVRIDFGAGQPTVYTNANKGIPLEVAVRSDPNTKLGYELQARATGYDPKTIKPGSDIDKQVIADLSATLNRIQAGPVGPGGKGGLASQLTAFRAEAAKTVFDRKIVEARNADTLGEQILVVGDLARTVACNMPSIEIGFGADAYAGLGGSVGGNVKIDIASGQVGAGFNVAVGAGVGIEAGPAIGASPSGSGIVSANVTTSGGGGLGLGIVGTHNIIGTDPGQQSLSVGRLGTPVLFVNAGAAAGLNTPQFNPLSCPTK